MRIRSDRSYRFVVEPDRLWAAIATTGAYQGWWPWLRDLDAAGLADGSTWRCAVKPPLPYVLRFTVVMDEVERPHRVAASISGDIVGSASLDVTAVEGGCEARLRSSLSPRNRILQLAAIGARPMVRFGHDWVLDTGARQFRERAL